MTVQPDPRARPLTDAMADAVDDLRPIPVPIPMLAGRRRGGC